MTVGIASTLVALFVWGSFALLRARPGSHAGNGEVSPSPTRPTSASIPRMSSDPAGSPPESAAPAPVPSAVAQVLPPPPVLQARQNTPPLRQSAGPARQAATHIAAKRTSRYARAADEPGLSADTRAAIYLSGAWERYRAGDASGARQMLSSAFALRKDLAIDSSQYDAGFRRLATRVRSERTPAS